MTQEAIEALLRKTIGLETVSIGSHTISRAVSHRMKACGLKRVETYLNLLHSFAEEELERLIEEVIVPETWFFRDREPFVFLSRYVMSDWCPHNQGKILRILSVPCATGEEPYSIAIALQEIGLTGKQFMIDAVDISKLCLNIAQAGIYKKNSFRGNDLAFQKRYFTQIGDEYHLHQSLKNSVNFLAGNLLEPNFLIQRVPYDVIFCRNVLIYFEKKAIEKTFQVVNRLLNKQGILFVGHAETGLIDSSEFVTVRHPFAFAYQKIDRAKNPTVLQPKNQQTSGKINQWTDLEKFGQEQRYSSVEKIRNSKSKTQNRNYEVTQLPITYAKMPDLAVARQLADKGQLEEAKLLCKAYLQENPTSAEAYFLLGQVHQAGGKEDKAEKCFHKAIYLEPNHYESLLHLALLKENRQDIAGANIIWNRIERLPKIANI